MTCSIAHAATPAARSRPAVNAPSTRGHDREVDGTEDGDNGCATRRCSHASLTSPKAGTAKL
jgi:hypothetical protein